MHFRLQGLINNDDSISTDDTIDLKQANTGNKCQNVYQRWELLRQCVRGKDYKDRITFNKTGEKAIQVKRFQEALDAILEDVRIWKQGMNFQSSNLQTKR